MLYLVFNNITTLSRVVSKKSVFILYIPRL
nr:hypothetical protein BAR15_180007 [Bartonella sp. AR 15-3]